MKRYRKVEFTIKSETDNNLVTVNTADLFTRVRPLQQGNQFIIEIKHGRQVCPVLFRVNRENGTTASTKCWPRVLEEPTIACPVMAQCRVLTYDESGQVGCIGKGFTILDSDLRV